jgi:hypothetical protein
MPRGIPLGKNTVAALQSSLAMWVFTLIKGI